MFKLFVILTVLMVGWVKPLKAYDCPKKVSYVSGDRLTKVLQPILKNVYRALKCDTKFVPFSARAATRAFVEGKVDGEVFRLELIERKYSHDYLKSTVPLLVLSGSLWLHPDHNSERPFGYGQGVAWEEHYARGKKGVGLREMDRKILAYNNHQISGFLMTNVTAKILADTQELAPPPVREK